MCHIDTINALMHRVIHAIGSAFSSKRLTVICGTPVLPNDGRSQWLASLLIPHHNRLTLIGNRDTGNVSGKQPCPINNIMCTANLSLPNLLCILFNESSSWCLQRRWLLYHFDRTRMIIVQYCSTRCGPLIQR